MKCKGKLPDDMRYHHCAVAYCSGIYVAEIGLTCTSVARGNVLKLNPSRSLPAGYRHGSARNFVFAAVKPKIDDYCQLGSCYLVCESVLARDNLVNLSP